MAISELKKEGKITPDDMNPVTYRSLKKPDVFRVDELNVINKTFDKLSKMDSEQLNEYLYGDMPFRVAKGGEVMMYSFVFYRDPEYCVRKYDTV